MLTQNVKSVVFIAELIDGREQLTDGFYETLMTEK
jgi:hypothetical protein